MEARVSNYDATARVERLDADVMYVKDGLTQTCLLLNIYKVIPGLGIFKAVPLGFFSFFLKRSKYGVDER